MSGDEKPFVRYPDQLVLEHEATREELNEIERAVFAWRERHHGLTWVCVFDKSPKDKLHLAFLPDLSQAARDDLTATLEPLLGVFELKPVHYGPEDLVMVRCLP